MSFDVTAQIQTIETPIRFLALGDSYTIGQSVPEVDRWPNQLASSMRGAGWQVDTVHYIATTGWRTDNLLSAMNNAELSNDFNLISVLIGVNNQYQGRPISQFIPDLMAIIDQGIQHAGGDTSQVFLVSIPDYAYTPFGNGNPNISAEIDQYNELKDSIAQVYGINYFYITDITREGLNDPELVAADNLHPSGKAYGLMADRIFDAMMLVQTTGFSEPQGQGLKVFPNPVANYLMFEQPVRGLVSIVDTMGQVVFSSEVIGDRIDVSHLPAGSYYLSIQQAGILNQIKWVKQ